MSSSDVISLSNVNLIRDEKELLSDINWSVKEGQHWAIFGRNGSGKTLLLKIVSGYLWPTSGTVEVLEKKFGEFDLRELRKKIGWVSLEMQYHFILGNAAKGAVTSSEVVLSGLIGTLGLYEKPTSEQKEKVQSHLAQLSLSNLSDRPFSLLSYGEQKKILLARALVQLPKLLILDEPATGLDLTAREEFLSYLQALTENKVVTPTIIYVTHHIEELMPFISNLLLLNAGIIAASGSKDEVLNGANFSKVLGFSSLVKSKGQRYFIDYV